MRHRAPKSLLRRLTPAVHKLDHAIGRLSRTRHVLVEYRTPVAQAILGPVAEALADATTKVWFTSEYPDRIRGLVAPETFLTHEQAEWRRFDVYLNCDPWAAARVRRCASRVNFFHGVAGKYDLDRPDTLPMGFEAYDRVAFINADRMRRYVEAEIIEPDRAALIGYPKIDRLATHGYDAGAVRAGLGLEPGRQTVLYAPTYSGASSLHLAGESIIAALADAGYNVIVKLHDRSLDPDPRYNEGIDWRARLRPLEARGRVRLAETGDSSPLLAAADLLVTDHSSIGFEYLVLDRPLVVFDAPDLPRAARISEDKVARLRYTATVVETVEGLVATVRQELEHPARLSGKRREVAREMFFEPGGATLRAVELIRPLLHCGTAAAVQTPEHLSAFGGGTR